MTKTTIALDCRPLQNRYAGRGIGTVVRNLLSQLVMSRCSTSLVLCGKGPQPPLRCGAYRMLKRPASHEWLWEQLLWPFDLLAMKAGVFHSTVSLGMLRDIGFPLVRPARSIATVYDLTPLHLPGLAPHARMKSYRTQRLAVRGADRVFTISEFVKKDLVATLGVREGRIRVLPLAVDETLANRFDTRSSPPDKPSGSFLLAVGEGENKNIATVLAVFEQLAAGGYAGGLRIIGSPDRQTGEVTRRCRESAFRGRIVFTGEVSLEQLVENYAACDCLLFPSLMEGFGLPVIEAMYCGAPVVASNGSSLPEAGGDAAVYCAPRDVDGFARAAWRLLRDEAHRKEVVEKGMRHARRRSWSEAADMVIATYEELGREK
jgi:glycosyltransferase involved in cell wall biosynthesis